MAGIYIHIPYCKQACHYCNFHFSTSLKSKTELINSLIKEIELQQKYLNQAVSSIYFGGGTPSILNEKDLEAIFSSLHNTFNLSEIKEITLEANPDDLSPDKLSFLKNMGVNRLSIGVQSFFNEDLSWMNRAHNQKQAHQCIELALKHGINNLTVDLIYGMPSLSNAYFIKNLEILASYNIPHFSAYSLTVEEKTALHHFVKQGKIKPISTSKAAEQFQLLMDWALSNHYEHYEISNFAKNKAYAQHNTAYWTGEHYLGIGPAAHSFNGTSRQWNVANNAGYIKAITEGSSYFETETLSPANRFNEYLLTGLRTKWGIDLAFIHTNHPHFFTSDFENTLNQYLSKDLLEKNGAIITLTNSGRLIADSIISDLFYTD